jgi:hypothetical protein
VAGEAASLMTPTIRPPRPCAMQLATAPDRARRWIGYEIGRPTFKVPTTALLAAWTASSMMIAALDASGVAVIVIRNVKLAVPSAGKETPVVGSASGRLSGG